MNRGVCKGCGAAILWATTKNGRPIPLDAEPNPRGNALLDGEQAHLLKPGEAGQRYMPHHATCPKAREFHGPRKVAS